MNILSSSKASFSFSGDGTKPLSTLMAGKTLFLLLYDWILAIKGEAYFRRLRAYDGTLIVEIVSLMDKSALNEVS